MFEYFYHEILRKTIISFGTLFNNISIKHEDSSDNVVSVVKIPLAYGPTQKFLARINQSPDLNKPFAITLPRMSFEFTGLTYDPSRKVSTVQNFTVSDPNDPCLTLSCRIPAPLGTELTLNWATTPYPFYRTSDVLVLIGTAPMGTDDGSVGELAEYKVRVEVISVPQKGSTFQFRLPAYVTG